MKQGQPKNSDNNKLTVEIKLFGRRGKGVDAEEIV